MAEKENQKKNWLIDSFQVTTCRDKRLSPFLNVFVFEGLTPEQKKIGQLFGTIQVFDYSEKSAYLPNLVAQVIKKEFFKESHRSSEASFEAALRKANLALSDLASHEIVSWIGKFQAVIGAIWENNFWFTQSGGGKIILVRKKAATEISAGLDNEESASHPIKTFSNISSGHLEDGDKIIFATENLFDKKYWEEFNRHVTVFSSSELDNLLRSTVELETDNTGFVVVNLYQKPVLILKKEELPENPSLANLNFFGQEQKQNPLSKNPAKKQAEFSLPSEKNQTITFDYSPFEKEPELYIKENEPLEIELLEKNKPSSSERKTENFFTQTHFKQKFLSLKEKLFFWKHLLFQKKFNKWPTFSQKNRCKLKDLKANWNFSSSKAKLEKFFQPLKSSCPPNISNSSKNFLSFFFEKYTTFFKKDFSFKKLIALFLVFLLIFFLAKTLWNKHQEKPLAEKINQETENATTLSEKETLSKNLKELAVLPEKIIASAFLKKKLYFISENNTFYQVENLDQKTAHIKKIDLPTEIKRIENLTSMNDLNLIFLSTQDQIYAFSPITGKILPHVIADLPQTKTASFSYLTYLYFLDAPHHQIFQYPRAGVGFGAKKIWLKESANLEQMIDFTADEAIYLLSSDGQISRYFRGKKTEDFSVEKDGKKIVSKKIRTSTESEWIFLLSPQEKTLFQINKHGQIVNQWSSPQLTEAEIMEVDFENKKIYVVNHQQAILEISFS